MLQAKDVMQQELMTALYKEELMAKVWHPSGAMFACFQADDEV